MFASTFVHVIAIMILALLTITQAPELIPAVVTYVANTEELPELDSFEEVQLEQPMPEVEAASDAPTDTTMAESFVTSEVEAVEVATDTLEVADSFDSLVTSDMLAHELGGGAPTGKGNIFGMATDGEVGGKRKGSKGGQALIGKFYDLKQDPNRNKLPYSGTFPDYIKTINRLASAGLNDRVAGEYYQAPTQLTFSQLLIPANTSANDAPKAFDVDKVVEPRGWFVHYSGTVIPPKNGEWRFVGFFDDLLIVYINGQPVLDGSWVPMCNVGRGPYDQSLRQDFGGPGVSGDRKAYAGKWIKLRGPTKVDILIGETPGGLVGGLLMCQMRGVEYPLRPDGSPVLPLFATSRFGSDRIAQEPFAQRYGIALDPPIWKTQNQK